jgi:hypothetical protein
MNEVKSDIPFQVLITDLRQKYPRYVIGDEFPCEFLSPLSLEIIRIRYVLECWIWVDFIQTVENIRADWYVNIIDNIILEDRLEYIHILIIIKK